MLSPYFFGICFPNPLHAYLRFESVFLRFLFLISLSRCLYSSSESWSFSIRNCIMGVKVPSKALLSVLVISLVRACDLVTAEW